VQIDHVIYGTTDLDAASARIEDELGLAVHPGGRHVGQGTHNRIVPLGDAYLELLAIHDREEAAASPIGRILLERITSDGLIAWAVRGDDVAAIAHRLGTELVTVRRDALTAQLTGVAEALREPCLPFFGQSNRRPGEGGAERLTWIEVAGDAARLREWLGGAELPVRVVDGAPAVRAVGIGGREFRPTG
jgi:hypothetical protein